MTPATDRPARGPTPLRVRIVQAVTLVFVISLTVFIYLIRDRVADLKQYGYLGIFVITLLANATVILPAPGLAITAAMAGVFPPAGVALASAAGATLGELSGYLAGFSGQAVVENRVMYARFEGWMKRYGPLTITALAFVPSPFFDVAGIAAGALHMPVQYFLMWCFLGKLPKMLLIAYAGAYSVDWIIRIFS